MKKIYLGLCFLTVAIFAAEQVRVVFVLGKPVWHDGNRRVIIQHNTMLDNQGILMIPKGAILTLEIGSQKIKIKGQNQFKLKDLLENRGQFEKFLDQASKRKAMSDQMLIKLQPAVNMGVRAAEDEEKSSVHWADDAEEQKKSEVQGSSEKVKTLYLKGEYEGVLNLLAANSALPQGWKDAETFFYAGAAFYYLGDFKQALDFFDQAHKGHSLPEALKPVRLYMSALACEAMGYYKRAAEMLEVFLIQNALAAEPEVYLFLAKCYAAAGNHPRKLETLNKLDEKFSKLTVPQREEVQNLRGAK